MCIWLANTLFKGKKHIKERIINLEDFMKGIAAKKNYPK